MPTECERGSTSLAEQQQQRQTDKQYSDLSDFKMEDKDLNDEMSTSQTSNGHNALNGGGVGVELGNGKKSSLISPDPTEYVAKSRVTRPTPPPPSYNPMQFVQIKPCNLYQTAQEQLKKAEEVKKIKEIKKEEPEDWQNNLDSWKSSRRKRVEHIIDRVVEVKKLELEEHDRSRRKSKTFSEMIEERGDRPRGRTKLVPLAVYNEDEANDFSDLGIGTSSASGKSSLSEDYDNNSVMSDNADLDKAIFENNHKHQTSTTREYISSPGYDTSSSTAPASSPDPCEYTYEGAIQDYKQRVSRASTASAGSSGYKLNGNANCKSQTAKEATPEQPSNGVHDAYPTRRGSKIEDRLIGFEVTSPSDTQDVVEKQKVDVPKIDISKRKEIFENQKASAEPKAMGNGGVPKVTLRERFKFEATASGTNETKEAVKKEVKRLSGDVTSIRDRMQHLEQQQHIVNAKTLVDIPVPPLKERLSSLQNAVTKEEVKKPPVVLIDARQLEIMKNEEETYAMKRMQRYEEDAPKVAQKPQISPAATTERDDSGILIADEEEREERNAQEQQLNAAIAALALEEQQLEAAANAVNQIEAEFAELSSAAVTATNEQPNDVEFSINEALELALEAIDKETTCPARHDTPLAETHNQTETTNTTDEEKELKSKSKSKTSTQIDVKETDDAEEEKISKEPIYENISAASSNELEADDTIIPNMNSNNNLGDRNPLSKTNEITSAFANTTVTAATNEPVIEQVPVAEAEPYYQVPKSSEPYYDAPKHLRPIPVYENIEIFYSGIENATLAMSTKASKMEPPKEKPPPPPAVSPLPFDDSGNSVDNTDTWSSSENTYETITARMPTELPSPPIKRMNSTKRIKKELRNKRSSFLGIEGAMDDEETFLELTVAPPPDMAQLLQEERRLEKQLYMKAGLCDSSDTGESRDSGVSENHSRQSSEHYTNSSEENDRHVDSPPHSLKVNEIIYQNEAHLTAAQTPLLQTVKGNSAESWTESATAAAAASKSLTEATATANAKMHSIEEKIREQEEVLRVERELLQLEQEELKRQRENLMLRENMARRELQHGAKMLMSANRRSLQDLNGVGLTLANGSGEPTAGRVFQPSALAHPLAQQPHPSQVAAQLAVAPTQQIYANLPNLQQQYYHQVDTDYRKSMSDLNEFSKRMNLPPTPPTKPMRSMHIATNGHGHDEFAARQRHSLNTQSYGGSLVKIATPTAVPRVGHAYPSFHHQSAQNLSNMPANGQQAAAVQHGNMTRNTLHALSATPKPKYTDGWVQVQNHKTYETNQLANDPAWLSAYQQKRKSMPDAYHNYNNNHWLVQEAEQRRVAEAQRRSMSSGNTPVHQQNGGGRQMTVSSNGKPLPDAIIQTLTERVQSKGIGERKRYDNYASNNNNSNIDKSPLHAKSYHHHSHPPQQQQQQRHTNGNDLNASLPPPASAQDKVLSVSGKKKCSHCGDELGRGAAMIIESLLLFYHINCFKCCVCHVQLGDGLNGTDVRVRNHKLHCQNCYSSDDGIKFSCV